jgi:hypothetical protein
MNETIDEGGSGEKPNDQWLIEKFKKIASDTRKMF